MTMTIHRRARDEKRDRIVRLIRLVQEYRRQLRHGSVSADLIEVLQDALHEFYPRTFERYMALADKAVVSLLSFSTPQSRKTVLLFFPAGALKWRDNPRSFEPFQLIENENVNWETAKPYPRMYRNWIIVYLGRVPRGEQYL